jgi:exodeoxyribonuclease VII large subunit
MALTVSSLTLRIAEQIEAVKLDEPVRGEAQNVSKRKRRAWFSLTDSYSEIRCYYEGSTDNLLIEEGDEVEVTGSVSLYEGNSTYQVRVENAELVGEGARKKAFRRTKQLLSQQGYISTTPTPLPQYPSRIALVTSKESAAIHDFKQSLRERFPVEVDVYPVSVQGSNATTSIPHAVRNVTDADIVVITRGGGANTDLEAFNEYEVAKAIAQHPLPTVTAIGHEEDRFIADLVSDYAVSTPTKAAEKVTPTKAAVKTTLQTQRRQAQQKIENRVERLRQRIQRNTRGAKNEVQSRVNTAQRRLHQLKQRLAQRDYAARIQEGFYPAQTDLDSVKKGDTVTLHTLKQTIQAEILSCHSKNE